MSGYPRPRGTPAERFARYCSEPDEKGCIHWLGYRTPAGYGYFHPSHDTAVRAHRYAYEVARGLIQEGLVLDHLCRNRACVNPEHLEAVTHQTNILRGAGVAAKLAAQTHCIRGHEFSPRRASNGQRVCPTCTRVRSRQSWERRKASA